MHECYGLLAEKKAEISERVHKFDDNGDKVIQFDEFTALMKDFDSSITKKLCLKLFKKAIQQKEEALDTLSI
jgi:hypothetical protein